MIFKKSCIINKTNHFFLHHCSGILTNFKRCLPAISFSGSVLSFLLQESLMKQLKNMGMIRCFKVFESVLYAKKSVTFCLCKIHLLFIVANDLNSMYSISNQKLTSGTCLLPGDSSRDLFYPLFGGSSQLVSG